MGIGAGKKEKKKPLKIDFADSFPTTQREREKSLDSMILREPDSSIFKLQDPQKMTIFRRGRLPEQNHHPDSARMPLVLRLLFAVSHLHHRQRRSFTDTRRYFFYAAAAASLICCCFFLFLPFYPLFVCQTWEKYFAFSSISSDWKKNRIPKCSEENFWWSWDEMRMGRWRQCRYVLVLCCFLSRPFFLPPCLVSLSVSCTNTLCSLTATASFSSSSSSSSSKIQ